jgi:DNA polymerase-3 subunit delta
MSAVAVEKIIGEWKKKKFKTVYWFEGEEPFFIDELVNYAEHHLLTEEEASFNLTVLYGRETSYTDVINACRRYPMFSEKQVIILKEAQLMKDIDKIAPYINKPLESTILVVAYRDKKLDGRTEMAKLVKSKAELVNFKKVADWEVNNWVTAYLNTKGFTITEKARTLLVDHTGNDLGVLSGEISKLVINLGKRKEINEDDVELYVGVSKEFNSFELQNAIANQDLYRALRIINYFESNPKAGPIQMVLPVLYSFFSKCYMLFGVNVSSESEAARAIGAFNVKDHMSAVKKYGAEGIAAILLLLHHYNLKSVGIGDSGSGGAELMKEMVVKMIRSPR